MIVANITNNTAEIRIPKDIVTNNVPYTITLENDMSHQVFTFEELTDLSTASGFVYTFALDCTEITNSGHYSLVLKDTLENILYQDICTINMTDQGEDTGIVEPEDIYFDIYNTEQGGGSGTDEHAVHYTPQTLTAAQKAQARANIGAAAEGEGSGKAYNLILQKDYEHDVVYLEGYGLEGYTPSDGDIWCITFDDDVSYTEYNNIELRTVSPAVIITTLGTDFNHSAGDTTLVVVTAVGSDGFGIRETTPHQADWNEGDQYSPAYIKNKPVIPTVKETDKYKLPFYVENTTAMDNIAKIQKVWGGVVAEFYTSTDNENWTLTSDGTLSEVTFTIPAKSRLYFKVTTYPGLSIGAAWRNLGTCNLGGNILSLRRPDFEDVMDDAERFYGGGFGDNAGIVDCSNLGMPRGRISGPAWGQGLFSGCRGLRKAPELPAIEVGQQGYENMFNNCYLLQEAPALPATNIGESCYNQMFEGCNSLLKAPALPATTVPNRAYRHMFANCYLLQEAPALPGTTLGNYCYDGMFCSCKSLVVGPSVAQGNNISYGSSFHQFFDGCSSLQIVPEIRITNINGTEMYYLYSNCKSLHTIYCHATNINNPNFGQCFNGLPTTGTFYCATGMKTTWEGLNVIPSGWTIVEM